MLGSLHPICAICVCLGKQVNGARSALLSTVDTAVISYHFTLLLQATKHNSTSKVCVSGSPGLAGSDSGSSKNPPWLAVISLLPTRTQFQGQGRSSGLYQRFVWRIKAQPSLSQVGQCYQHWVALALLPRFWDVFLWYLQSYDWNQTD